jgi:hypothetical protein
MALGVPPAARLGTASGPDVLAAKLPPFRSTTQDTHPALLAGGDVDEPLVSVRVAHQQGKDTP